MAKPDTRPSLRAAAAVMRSTADRFDAVLSDVSLSEAEALDRLYRWSPRGPSAHGEHHRARSAEEATQVLEEAARGELAISSLAEESRPPAASGGDPSH